MITSTISYLEAIATVFVVLAILLKSIDLYDCYLDLKAAVTDRRWETQFIARGNLRTSFLHLLVKVVIFAFVLLADFTPPADPDRPITFLGLVLYSGFILIILLLLTATYLSRSDRRALLVRLTTAGPSQNLLTRVGAIEAALKQIQLRSGGETDV